MNKFQKKHDSKKIDNSIKNNSIKSNNDIDMKNENDLKKDISFSSEKISDSKEIVFDIPVNITIELGKAKLKIKELLDFSKGSMFFLTKNKEDPLKIFANGKLVAFGEIVMSDNKYGVRIISIKNSLNTIK